MPQLTAAQARLVDPVLSEIARGFNSMFSPIADILFPRVTVTQRGGQIIEFSKDDFILVNSQRAFGANTKRIQYGFSKSNFSLVDYRLEGTTPAELQAEAEAGPGIDLLAGAVRNVRNQQAREREYQAAQLATTAANYGSSNKVTLSGTSQWSNTASDPFGDIMAAKEAVRQQIGRKPNVLTLGPTVLTALRSHPKVLDRLSTATDRPPATIAQLAALFELDRVVEGDGTYWNGTAFQDMWGKFALLAYTTPASAAEMGAPNYGYTYQLSVPYLMDCAPSLASFDAGPLKTVLPASALPCGASSACAITRSSWKQYFLAASVRTKAEANESWTFCHSFSRSITRVP